MANVEWIMAGLGWSNCNCAWGCPCQFNALPTHGDCRALGCWHIEEGHHGKVSLDDLHIVLTASWPGPIHLGNGTAQIIIDERASPEQRKALEAIASGQDTDPGGSLFQIFGSTLTSQLETLYRPIEFDCSLSGHSARLRIPGLVESSGGPIHNPMTGEAHHVSVSLPGGFEYREAAFMSGSSRTENSIALDLQETHGHLARFNWSTHGYVD